MTSPQKCPGVDLFDWERMTVLLNNRPVPVLADGVNRLAVNFDGYGNRKASSLKTQIEAAHAGEQADGPSHCLHSRRRSVSEGSSL